jgi:hypothetical protein
LHPSAFVPQPTTDVAWSICIEFEELKLIDPEFSSLLLRQTRSSVANTTPK